MITFVCYTRMNNQNKENNRKLEITEKNASDILCNGIIIAITYINYQSILLKQNWNSIIINSSTAIPLFTTIATFMLAIKNYALKKILSIKKEDNIMFNSAQRLIEKFKKEGREEGKAEAQTEIDRLEKENESLKKQLAKKQKPKRKI